MSFLAVRRRYGVVESVLDQMRDLIDYECANFDEIGDVVGTPGLGIGESFRKSAEDVGGDMTRILMDHVIDDLLPCLIACLEPERRPTTSLNEDLHTRCKPFEDLFAMLLWLVEHPRLEVIVRHLLVVAVGILESFQDDWFGKAELHGVDILQDGLGGIFRVQGWPRLWSTASPSKEGDCCIVQEIGGECLTE